jgi:serine/alanine adding enzyme
MRVELYESSDSARWQALVENSSDATIGHYWAWREVIAAAYGFDSFYLAAEEHAGEPIAVLPLIRIRSRLYGAELASMPYIDYGAVCHRDCLDTDLRDRCDRLLYEHAIQLGQAFRAKRLHVRSTAPCDPRFELSTEKVTQHLALADSPSRQLERLPAERRNRIRRCERLGVTSEIVEAIEGPELDRVWEIYTINMRDLGSPTHSHEFFRQLVRHFRDQMSIILVRHEDRTIAAALSFQFRGFMSLPWSGATLDARPVYGSNALYWAAISLGIQRGCHTFDFGRSSFGSGIYEFKRQWGPRPHQAYWATWYFRRGAKAPRQRAELRLATSLWRRVPLVVARTVGPALRRGISN